MEIRDPRQIDLGGRSNYFRCRLAHAAAKRMAPKSAITAPHATLTLKPGSNMPVGAVPSMPYPNRRLPKNKKRKRWEVECRDPINPLEIEIR